MKNFLELAQTPAVHDVQQRKGSLGLYGTDPSPLVGLDPDEVDFVTSADSFYMATVNEDGWPYVQHKGGVPGFVKMLGPNRIGWVERTGNRQYLGAGNVSATGRVAMIIVDYERRMRLKLLGRATYLADIPGELTASINPDDLRSDGAFIVDVEATAWNCPKHITPRIRVAESDRRVEELQRRIAELEAELSRRP